MEEDHCGVKGGLSEEESSRTQWKLEVAVGEKGPEEGPIAESQVRPTGYCCLVELTGLRPCSETGLGSWPGAILGNVTWRGGCPTPSLPLTLLLQNLE